MYSEQINKKITIEAKQQMKAALDSIDAYTAYGEYATWLKAQPYEYKAQLKIVDKLESIASKYNTTVHEMLKYKRSIVDGEN